MTMEHEIVNKETPEMKQLISGIREVSKRLREIAQTHRPLFGGEIYLTGREVCERLFVSPRTLQDYRDKGIIPYTQIAGKILYRLSDINSLLQENYRRESSWKKRFPAVWQPHRKSLPNGHPKDTEQSRHSSVSFC